MEEGFDREVQVGGLVAIEQSRAIQEVQGAMVIAKRFQRDEIACLNKILKACERKSLAEISQYAYPRGNTMITGPSIRLAEVIGQNWPNLFFGIQELSRGDNVSEVEAYAWDLETNVKVSRKFQASHIRYSKARGLTDLKDPRDIYEMVANQGARRLRACILQVIPGDIAEAAQKKCDETLKKDATEPLKDRIVKMVGAFEELGVSQAMIETRLGHPMKAIIEIQLASLRKIYMSIKDGIAKREDFFDLNVAAAALNEKIKDDKGKPKKDIYKVKETLATEKKDDKDDKDALGELHHHLAEGEKEEEKEDPIKKLYHGVGDKAFAEFVSSHPTAIPDMEQVYQDEIRASWGKRAKKKGGLLEGKPYPLDVSPESFEGANDIPPDEEEKPEDVSQDATGTKSRAAFLEVMRELMNAFPNISAYRQALKEIGEYSSMNDVPTEKEDEVVKALNLKLDALMI